MIEKYNEYIPLKTAKKNDFIKLFLYQVEVETVTISDIAKTYRVRPQVVYTIVRDFEALGYLEIDRKGRSLILNEGAISKVERELERRGYQG
jgi:transposase